MIASLGFAFLAGILSVLFLLGSAADAGRAAFSEADVGPVVALEISDASAASKLSAVRTAILLARPEKV